MVDDVYPQSNDATHKIRERSKIKILCGSVDQELLAVKIFYVFFYSAFGSLFPLMAVYFKQIGMNPWQCGLLIGIRPFVEFLTTIFLGSYGHRSKRGKILLLASIATWIIFTLPIRFIQPPVTSCIALKNNSEYELILPYIPGFIIMPHPISFDQLGKVPFENSSNISNEALRRVERAIRPISAADQSPLDVTYTSNYDSKIHDSWVSPIATSIVYRTEDIQKVFYLLLLLVIIGEFFSAPAITLADSTVISILGEDADRFGYQRMFGSLGWGFAMLLVGIALDHSTAFPNHPCGSEIQEKNYKICFTTFLALMGAALITATQITFQYVEYDEPEPQQKPDVNNSRSATQTKMFAQTIRKLPKWITVSQQFKSFQSASFWFVAWLMGFGIGLNFAFLFWHLQDYGGSPTLFGVASIINHISDIFAYFFSFRLITQIGHVNVLYLGLAGNILRFSYISYLKDPWLVLPFEFMHGITHTAVWAACCSYIAHNTPHQLRSSAQGVLQGFHHGLGRGCGAVIGGLFINYFGIIATFRGYSVICMLVLTAFILINFHRKEEAYIANIPISEDSRHMAEESSHQQSGTTRYIQ